MLGNDGAKLMAKKSPASNDRVQAAENAKSDMSKKEEVDPLVQVIFRFPGVLTSGWWFFSNMFSAFTPKITCGNDPILTCAYVSNGLKLETTN